MTLPVSGVQAVAILAASIAASCGTIARLLPFLKRRAMDVPNGRSSHERPTPRGGGLGILAGLCAGGAAGWSLGIPLPGAELVVATGIVAAVSWLDDVRRGVPAPIRLLAQCAAAAIVVAGAGGISRMPLPEPLDFQLGPAGAALAVLWIVAVTNIYNFLDGIDGLAGVQGIIAGLALAALGWGSALSAAGLAIAGAAAGFLVYNWHPAKVFMGDAGSATLGFLLASLPLQLSAPADHKAVFAMALFLWLFLSDGAYTLLHRLLRGERIWEAHRSHLYQRLVQAGLRHDRAVLRIAGLMLCVAIPTVASVRTTDVDAHWAVLAFACAAFLYYRNSTIRQEQKALSSTAHFRKPRGESASIFDHVVLEYRRALILACQVLLFAISVTAAYLLRFDFDIPANFLPSLYQALALSVVVKTATFFWARMDRGWWRFASVVDVRGLLVANLAGSFLFSMAALLWIEPFPRSVTAIDFILSFLLTAAARFAVRVYNEAFMAQSFRRESKRTLIYGAGSSGTTLVREARMNGSVGLEIAGYVDDDHHKFGMRIMGLPVLGGGRDIPRIAERFRRQGHPIDQVVIAMPAATGRDIREALANCRAAGLECRTIPGMADLLAGKATVSQLRKLSLEDLLGREPVRLEESAIRDQIAGRSVLVTGAAGSIGSELCRQIAAYSPERLVIFDQAESDLFRIDLELRGAAPALQIVTTIGDIRDPDRLEQVLAANRVEAVFHAAAYKHVPMMEANVAEAVRNNVIGTRNLVRASCRQGVSSFVMISSDKAVNPSSVMGATKRAAELIVKGLAEEAGRGARFVSVRFGNVLGSNGSVVPQFQAQIAAGGPVTVTHPEMRRYFMTIREAVQLVLQASIMGQGHETFVLDMGDPVRIVDLARNMIRLAGYTPDEDIEIRFTGMRPGEKLFEELITSGEDVAPTRHEKIKIFRGDGAGPAVVERWLQELEFLLSRRDRTELLAHLRLLVPEYQPGSQDGDADFSVAAGRL